ncbi:HigA family addiction module antidote protein [Thiorhodococcus mannitoliphagus]|uniref:HigA family addiction module antidote protein n=1 Tax=Thiorhodococcus mannitoliphagus TaxID=329406 RepID=A0A6P1E0H6_9GAMM|nr:HigA family addiction module antitoxin [Thiorhodococcus mannitoliphagus]NEX21504.1 HigA family addiction module antidote protein [Thiorhodococcus mannitoliphagus]
MARMFNPPHPGEALREDVLPALGLSVSEAARQLGVSRLVLSRVLNGRTAITPDLARRLALWLATDREGPSAESFLREQVAYDVWQLEQSSPPPLVQPAQRPAEHK